jgi:Na+-transporting NADH:ubiquinone oxidoreductase subunit A
VRVISGNPLTGTAIGKEGYVGFFDHHISVLPEGDYYEFIGWITPGARKISFQRSLGLFSFLSPGKERVADTNTHGEPRAFVQSGIFEQVTPMDILPTHLIKSIMGRGF